MEIWEDRINSLLFQKVTGRVENKRAKIEVSNELIKEIANISDYFRFKRNVEGTISIDYSNQFGDARTELEKQVERVIVSEFKAGNWHEDNGVVVINKVVTVDDLDLDKLRETIQKCEVKYKEKERKNAEERELRNKISEEVEKLRNEGIKVREHVAGFDIYVEHKKNSFVEATSIPASTLQQKLDVLKELTPIQVYKEYTNTLRENNQELRTRINELEEQLENC